MIPLRDKDSIDAATRNFENFCNKIYTMCTWCMLKNLPNSLFSQKAFMAVERVRISDIISKSLLEAEVTNSQIHKQPHVNVITPVS
jgi:hypothetical protein